MRGAVGRAWPSCAKNIDHSLYLAKDRTYPVEAEDGRSQSGAGQPGTGPPGAWRTAFAPSEIVYLYSISVIWRARSVPRRSRGRRSGHDSNADLTDQTGLGWPGLGWAGLGHALPSSPAHRFVNSQTMYSNKRTQSGIRSSTGLSESRSWSVMTKSGEPPLVMRCTVRSGSALGARR